MPLRRSRQVPAGFCSRTPLPRTSWRRSAPFTQVAERRRHRLQLRQEFRPNFRRPRRRPDPRRPRPRCRAGPGRRHRPQHNPPRERYVVDGAPVRPRTVIDLDAGTATIPAHDVAFPFARAYLVTSYLPALTWYGTDAADEVVAATFDDHTARLIADGRGGDDHIYGTVRRCHRRRSRPRLRERLRRCRRVQLHRGEAPLLTTRGTTPR